jgi:hypothetical protein
VPRATLSKKQGESMYSRHLLAAVAAAVTLGSAGAAIAKDPAEIAITPGSPEALIVLKAESLPVPRLHKTSYWITLQTYDPAQQKMVGGPFGGTAMIAARPREFVDGYLVKTVKPGTYAFLDFVMQDYWALCFNGGSLQFTVKPGEVIYLGEMDVRRHGIELERLAISTGQTRTRGGNPVHFFDTVAPPRLAPIDEAQMAAVAAMVKARMPKTTVAPRPVQFAPARFGSGHDLFGLMRICGGYYQGKAKKGPGEKAAPAG